MTSILDKINDGFYLIEYDVVQPYNFTDPVPNPGAAWYPNEVPLNWHLYDQSRVLDYLNGRSAYVISQLP